MDAYTLLLVAKYAKDLSLSLYISNSLPRSFKTTSSRSLHGKRKSYLISNLSNTKITTTATTIRKKAKEKLQMQEGDQGAPKSSLAPRRPPFSTSVTDEEEEEEEEAAAAAATLGFYGLSFSQLLTEDPPPPPWAAAADLGGESMLDFGRRQYMSPPHPQLPTMMHAPSMLRTLHYEAKPDSYAYPQPAYQSSLPQELLNPFLQPTALISPNYKLFCESNGAFESVSDPYWYKASQMSNLAVEKPPGDGYKWRKYGQKQVKGGEFPRSYYKCSAAKCDVKKLVERSFDGNIKEIIYKGEHNHQPSQNGWQGKEGGYDDNDTESKFENLLVSTDDDEDGAAINEGDSKSGLKINKDTESMESTSQRTVMMTGRVILQTISETDLLDDGYKWRKYGQKHVKGNNHPRSYYKCTNTGCNVRKKVERSKKDPKAVLTTYEDRHNHDVPKARSSSSNIVSAEPASDNYHHQSTGLELKISAYREG